MSGSSYQTSDDGDAGKLQRMRCVMARPQQSMAVWHGCNEAFKGLGMGGVEIDASKWHSITAFHAGLILSIS